MPNVVNADAEGCGGASVEESAAAVDFAFLAQQTFDDPELAREVLGLFVEQARRVVPSLPGLGPDAQRDAAHLLKGSARGIGAWAVAAIAEAYETAASEARASIHPDVVATFAAAEAAIEAHLAG